MNDRNRGAVSMRSQDGKITLHSDPDEYDWHINARPNYDLNVLTAMLEIARGMRLQVLDDADPEIEDDGSITIYLVPIEPVDDMPDEEPQYTRLARVNNRLLVAATALSAGAFGIELLRAVAA